GSLEGRGPCRYGAPPSRSRPAPSGLASPVRSISSRSSLQRSPTHNSLPITLAPSRGRSQRPYPEHPRYAYARQKVSEFKRETSEKRVSCAPRLQPEHAKQSRNCLSFLSPPKPSGQIQPKKASSVAVRSSSEKQRGNRSKATHGPGTAPKENHS